MKRNSKKLSDEELIDWFGGLFWVQKCSKQVWDVDLKLDRNLA